MPRRAEPSNDYADDDERDAPPGVSTADLERRPDDIEETRRLRRSSRDWTDQEKQHNREHFGETYAEKYGRAKVKKCIHYCRNPGSREAKRCSTCYGWQEVRPMEELPGDIELPIGRHARFWRWVGWVLGQVWLGLTYPLRLDQARMRGLLEEILPEIVEETVAERGMAIEMTCPTCAAAELTRQAATEYLKRGDMEAAANGE